MDIGGEKEIDVYMARKDEEIMELFNKKEQKLKKNREKKE